MEDQQILMTRILKSISPFPSYLISLSNLYPRRTYQIIEYQEILKTRILKNITTVSLLFLPQTLPSSYICPTSIQGGHIQIMDDQENLKTLILKSNTTVSLLSLPSLYPRRTFLDYGGSRSSKDPDSQK